MASVRIRWFGHSGFSIRDGKTALIDPWFEGNPKAPAGGSGSDRADLLLLTHDHFDHAGDAVAMAKKTGAIVVAIFELAGDLKAKGVLEAQLLHGGGGMNVGGTVGVQGFEITMTEAHHSCTLGAPVGYVLKTPSGPRRRRGGGSLGLRLGGLRPLKLELNVATVDAGCADRQGRSGLDREPRPVRCEGGGQEVA